MGGVAIGSMGTETVTMQAVKAAPQGADAAEKSLLGEMNLWVTETPGPADGLRQPLPPDMFKAILKMIDQHFEALLTIAKNMGVSDEEREAAERLLKEIKEKRRRLEDLKKEELKLVIQIAWMMKTDAEARRQVEERQAEMQV